jgi:hypothetical protein
VSNVSVLNWVRQYGAKSELIIDTKTEIEVMELDEMWHYCQKKSLALAGNFNPENEEIFGIFNMLKAIKQVINNELL